MIDLDAMERDPWSTWPVQKDDIRRLGVALERSERIIALQSALLQEWEKTLHAIAESEPLILPSELRKLAQRALQQDA